MQKVHDAGERSDMRVLPEAEIFRRDAALGSDGGGLGEDESRTAHGTAAEVDEVPVIGESVFAGILAHGRNGDAVGQRKASERQGRKKMRGFGHIHLDEDRNERSQR